MPLNNSDSSSTDDGYRILCKILIEADPITSDKIYVVMIQSQELFREA